MKRSRNAPSGANKRARAPIGRATDGPTSAEGPAPSQAPEALPSGTSSRPPGAGPAACEPQEPPGSPPSLLFSARGAPDVWLSAARSSLLDLLAAAREGARRPHRRVLARAEIRRQARDAFAGASALLDEAAEALRAAAPLVNQRTSS